MLSHEEDRRILLRQGGVRNLSATPGELEVEDETVEEGITNVMGKIRVVKRPNKEKSSARKRSEDGARFERDDRVYGEQTDEVVSKTAAMGLVPSRSSGFKSFVRFLKPHGEQTDEGLLPEAAAIEEDYVESASPQPFNQAKTEEILSDKIAKTEAVGPVDSMSSSPELMTDAKVMETGPGELTKAMAIGAGGTRSLSPKDVDNNEADDVETAANGEVFARSPSPESSHYEETEETGPIKEVIKAAAFDIVAAKSAPPKHLNGTEVEVTTRDKLMKVASLRPAYLKSPSTEATILALLIGAGGTRSPSPEDVDNNETGNVETAANVEVLARSPSPESSHYDETEKTGPMKEVIKAAAFDIVAAKSAPPKHLNETKVGVTATDKFMEAASTVYSRYTSTEAKMLAMSVRDSNVGRQLYWKMSDASRAFLATKQDPQQLQLLSSVIIDDSDDEDYGSGNSEKENEPKVKIQHRANSNSNVVVVAAIGVVVGIAGYYYRKAVLDPAQDDS